MEKQVIGWGKDLVRYEDHGIRPFYEQFTVVILDGDLRKALPASMDLEQADVLLGYGFIHPKEGPALEVLAAGRFQGDSFTFTEPDLDDGYTLSLRAHPGVYGSPISDEDGALAKAYEKRLQQLEAFAPTQDVACFRRNAELDPMRHECYFDLFAVIFRMKDREDEIVWVRGDEIIRDGDGYEEWDGTIVVEPRQNFGLHAGDSVCFWPGSTRQNEPCLYAELGFIDPDSI